MDVAPLPGCLDRSPVVALPNEGHCSPRRDTVEHSDAGERRAGSPAPTVTRDFHPLGPGAAARSFGARRSGPGPGRNHVQSGGERLQSPSSTLMPPASIGSSIKPARPATSTRRTASRPGRAATQRAASGARRHGAPAAARGPGDCRRRHLRCARRPLEHEVPQQDPRRRWLTAQSDGVPSSRSAEVVPQRHDPPLADDRRIDLVQGALAVGLGPAHAA